MTYMTMAQAIDYLSVDCGLPCTKQWMLTALEEGHGPAYTKASARKRFFTKDDIDQWRHSFERVPAGQKRGA
jgi:hypothetical protein